MSDIVERLEALARSEHDDLSTAQEAADEIRRLWLIEDEHIEQLKENFELSDDGAHYHDWQDAMRASGRYQDEVS